MSDIVAIALIGAGATVLAAVLGVAVGGAVSEWRSTRAEQRAANRAMAVSVADWRRASLRDTRLGLRHQLAGLEAVALGDVETSRRHELAIEDLDVNIALVGDEAAIRAYRDLVAELRDRFGRTLGADYTVRSATVVNDLLAALDVQEERLLRGQPLTRVDPGVAPELFGPEGLAARLDIPPRLPSLAAVEARAVVDVMSVLGRRRRIQSKRRDHEPPPER